MKKYYVYYIDGKQTVTALTPLMVNALSHVAVYLFNKKMKCKKTYNINIKCVGVFNVRLKNNAVFAKIK